MRAKQTTRGPMIRFQSIAMPRIEEVDPPEGQQVLSLDGKQEGQMNVLETGRCMRNFITFPDETVLKKIFPQHKPRPATKNFCPISRQPARYFDPVTHIAYANLQGYRVLREAYYNQLESKGDTRQPEVAAWIEWRRRTKAASHQQAAALRQKQQAATQAAALAAAQQQQAQQAAQQLQKGGYATVKTVAQTSKPTATTVRTASGLKPAAAAIATMKPVGTMKPTAAAVRQAAITVKPALAGGMKPIAAAPLRPSITAIRPMVATMKPSAAAGPTVVQQIQHIQKPTATVQPVQQVVHHQTHQQVQQQQHQQQQILHHQQQQQQQAQQQQQQQQAGGN